MSQVGLPDVGAGLRGGKIRPATIVLIAMLVVSGCTARAASPQSSRAASPYPASRPSHVEETVAEALLTTTPSSLRQRWYLFSAEQQLDAQCMRNLELKYLITSPGPEPSAKVITTDTIDDDHASSYGVSVLQTTESGIPAEDEYVNSLPGSVRARYDDALEGTGNAQATLRLPSGATGSYSTGGCIGSVRKKIYGSVRGALEDTLVPQDMANLFVQFLRSDRPYLSALTGWKKCMSSNGLDFSSPDAAIASIQALAATRGTSAAELSKREGTVASTDVECDAATHLRRSKSAARIQFVRRQPEWVLSQLQTIYVTRENAVQLALRVL